MEGEGSMNVEYGGYWVLTEKENHPRDMGVDVDEGIDIRLGVDKLEGICNRRDWFEIFFVLWIKSYTEKDYWTLCSFTFNFLLSFIIVAKRMFSFYHSRVLRRDKN